MKWLLRLYPREWRERYGEELAGILDKHGVSALDFMDIARSALSTRWQARSRRNLGDASRRGSATKLALQVTLAVALATGALLVGGQHSPANSQPRYQADIRAYQSSSVYELALSNFHHLAIPHMIVELTGHAPWTVTSVTTDPPLRVRTNHQGRAYTWDFGTLANNSILIDIAYQKTTLRLGNPALGLDVYGDAPALGNPTKTRAFFSLPCALPSCFR